MKTVIELSLNPSHEKFAEMMRELNEVVDILNRNTTLESAYKFLKMTSFDFIEFGRGSNHIWVKFSYQGRLSERVLIATE